MAISIGMILGVGEIVVGLCCPGSGIATNGLCRVCRSAASTYLVKPVVNEALAPIVEKAGAALDLEGSTVGELAKDLYCNHTNYAELFDIYPS